MFSDLLSVAGNDARNDIRVTYTQNNVCAVKGSTASLRCDVKPQAQKVIWVVGSRSVDLKADQQYSNRVRYYEDFERRRIKIGDVRESDSAEYQCRVKTQPPDVNLTGSPGVSLSVTGDPAFFCLLSGFSLFRLPSKIMHISKADLSVFRCIYFAFSYFFYSCIFVFTLFMYNLLVFHTVQFTATVIMHHVIIKRSPPSFSPFTTETMLLLLFHRAPGEGQGDGLLFSQDDA